MNSNHYIDYIRSGITFGASDCDKALFLYLILKSYSEFSKETLMCNDFEFRIYKNKVTGILVDSIFK